MGLFTQSDALMPPSAEEVKQRMRDAKEYEKRKERKELALLAALLSIGDYSSTRKGAENAVRHAYEIIQAAKRFKPTDDA